MKNLKGIEHFYALEKLWCPNNQISEIDVSKNLRLTQLACNWNDIKELDLSKNTSLNSLICNYNQITKLDLSKNPKLEDLSCYDNPLTELDLTKNPALTSLDCSSTQLTELDLTKNPSLSSLNCSYTQLTELDLTKNPALTSLNFSNTQLTELDLTKNPSLTSLKCSNTQLTESNISYFVNNFSLTLLYCDKIKLQTLDLSKLKELKYLSCNYCGLSSLNIEECPKLTDLSCHDNELTSLDVSKNVLLRSLLCGHNQIEILDLSSNNSLEGLTCEDNYITKLLLNNESPLIYIFCCKNKISGIDMDELLNNLPINKKSVSRIIKLIDSVGGYKYEKNLCTSSQVEIAKSKGWTIWKGHGAAWEDYSGPVYPSKISPFYFNSTYSLTVGESKYLDYSITPMEATLACLSWTTDNANIAEVSEYGMVTAKAEGTATITCFSTEGNCESASFTINVSSSETGIADIIFNSNINNSIYDVYGRKLTRPRKGINIINGKKVVMK